MKQENKEQRKQHATLLTTQQAQMENLIKSKSINDSKHSPLQPFK